MATWFVNSNATGTNAGTSWLNAWTSIASATGVAAGDIAKVEYRHSESGLSAAVNFANGTLTNPVQIVSCDKDNSDAARVGASIAFGTTSAIGFFGSLYCYGVTLGQTASLLRLAPPNSGIQIYDTCVLAPTGSTGLQFGDGSNSRWSIQLLNTTIDLSGTSSSAALVSISGTTNSIFSWVGGSYICRSPQTNLFGSLTGVAVGRIAGVIFSGTVTSLISGSATQSSNNLTFTGCIPPTYTNIFTTSPTSYCARINLDGFQSGTLTAALLPPTLEVDVTGTIAADLTRYRAGGANDGSNANSYSWAFTTNSTAAQFTTPITSPPISRWVTAGSHTVTVYIASGATQHNDDVWLEVMSPSEAVSATGQARYQSTRRAPLATPAALTTDGVSTWTGTGVGTLQKISVTINPTVAGVVTVRVNVADPSSSIYVDPKLDVS